MKLKKKLKKNFFGLKGLNFNNLRRNRGQETTHITEP